MNGWLDLPVVQGLEYFTGILAKGYMWAGRYAALFGLIGIVWSAFKLAMSRMTVKDLWWDTLFKWIGFILLFNLYPSIIVGVGAIAHEIGMKAGGGKAAIISELKAMRESIKADIATNNALDNGQDAETKSRFQEYSNESAFETAKDYNDFMNAMSGKSGAYQFDSKSDKAQGRQKTKQRQENKKFGGMFSSATLKALDNVLVERNLDGTKGDNLTDTYLDLDLYIKDANGDDTFYLSPSALIRVALLASNVMYDKEQIQFLERKEEIEASDMNMLQKIGAGFTNNLSRLPDRIVILFCCIVLILSTLFAEVQYIMTIFEFTLVAGIGAIFIPLMLFDGTKDIPKKFIPVFISFLIKMAVITLCLMFVFYLVIESCINTIVDDGYNIFVKFADICFNAIICYVMTQNAPKIAQTILTGQPQLSMGEFLAGAATAGVTAGTMHGMAKNAIRGTMNTGMNAVGEARKMNEARKGAARQTAKLGGTRREGNIAAIRAMGAVASADLKERVRAGAERFQKGNNSNPIFDRVKQTLAFGNGQGTYGGSGSGGGTNAYGIHGQGSMQGHAGETLSAVSNQNFKNATRYDERTGQQRNMTAREFNAEKEKQGKMIGDNIALDMAVKKQAKNTGNAKKRDNALGENLTGNTRANN
nr:type IV secretion system protein [Treponema socranskii]